MARTRTGTRKRKTTVRRRKSGYTKRKSTKRTVYRRLRRPRSTYRRRPTYRRRYVKRYRSKDYLRDDALLYAGLDRLYEDWLEKNGQDDVNGLGDGTGDDMDLREVNNKRARSEPLAIGYSPDPLTYYRTPYLSGGMERVREEIN